MISKFYNCIVSVSINPGPASHTTDGSIEKKQEKRKEKKSKATNNSKPCHARPFCTFVPYIIIIMPFPQHFPHPHSGFSWLIQMGIWSRHKLTFKIVEYVLQTSTQAERVFHVTFKMIAWCTRKCFSSADAHGRKSCLLYSDMLISSKWLLA